MPSWVTNSPEGYTGGAKQSLHILQQLQAHTTIHRKQERQDFSCSNVRALRQFSHVQKQGKSRWPNWHFEATYLYQPSSLLIACQSIPLHSPWHTPNTRLLFLEQMVNYQWLKTKQHLDLIDEAALLAPDSTASHQIKSKILQQ